MIDAYDVLGLSVDCSEEDVKKAYKKMSLQCHPDKNVGGDAKETAEKFDEVKKARDTLQDPERRKIYDTFGVDLGEERPEMEVWNIGISTLLSPMGGFVLKTIIARLVIWLVGWKWIGRLFMVAGFACAGLYYGDVTLGEVNFRSEGPVSLLLNVAVMDVVVILNWLWPLLSDGVVVFYLVSEVVGLPLLVESWQIGVGVGIASLIVARLLIGWWFWIIGLEVLFAFILLVALTISSGIMRLWIDSVQTQHGEKLKEQRKRLRVNRKAMEDEIAELKKKVQALQKK
eukprot:gb/GFBE01045050.1/.p1 GENE.gb/GFBE01045050.1/~~gb/GFBE01045050.1/.p1  ORF type:complete len:286 (+),score=80.30 gb/GFBE01045050.1/:1-858(+)